jgi:hypothetical protein
MDGVCKVLDKIDLVAVTPTGSGKTGFFFLTILVMIVITANPSLCPSASFPKDPAIVVVCPTNSIEQQMVSPSMLSEPGNLLKLLPRKRIWLKWAFAR